MMEIWFKLIYIYVIPLAATFENPDGPCTIVKVKHYGQQIICTNITSHYLETNGLPLNLTSYFGCNLCNLSALTESTFNFCKNRVAYLNLSDSRINSIGDFAFAKFPLLKLLVLRHNNLTKFSDFSFRNVKRLLQLDLSSNSIKILQDDLFVELEQLDMLNLNRNRISRIDPGAFNGLVSLKYLYLNENDITYVHPYLFKQAYELKILYLEVNKIKEINHLAFTNLKNLQFLYLNNNSLEFLSEYNFKQLPNLVDLQLRNNSLRDIPRSCFNGLRKLQFLYLGNNNISNIARQGFIGLESLLTLDLMGNNLHTFHLDVLQEAPSLQTTWLEGNAMNNLSISKEMKTHQHLSSLDLQNNNLSYFNYKILSKKLPRLQELIIGNNSWKCEFFIPMQDFFEGANMSLCMNYSCKSNQTVDFVEELCRLGYNGTDGGLDRSNLNAFNYLLSTIYVLHVIF